MELTTRQAAEKLGITINMLRARTVKGLILSINRPEKGKRVNYSYDSKLISKFLKENGQIKNRKAINLKNKVTLNPPGFMSNINNKLNNIESKLNLLLELWK